MSNWWFMHEQQAVGEARLQKETYHKKLFSTIINNNQKKNLVIYMVERLPNS